MDRNNITAWNPAIIFSTGVLCSLKYQLVWNSQLKKLQFFFLFSWCRPNLCSRQPYTWKKLAPGLLLSKHLFGSHLYWHKNKWSFSFPLSAQYCRFRQCSRDTLYPTVRWCRRWRCTPPEVERRPAEEANGQFVVMLQCGLVFVSRCFFCLFVCHSVCMLICICAHAYLLAKKDVVCVHAHPMANNGHTVPYCVAGQQTRSSRGVLGRNREIAWNGEHCCRFRGPWPCFFYVTAFWRHYFLHRAARDRLVSATGRAILLASFQLKTFERRRLLEW